MALNGTIESQYKIYLYNIDAVTINCNGESTTLTDIQVSNMYLERNYDDDYLPIFMMKLVIPDTLYYKICNNYNNTTFTIVVKNMVYVNENKNTDISLWFSGVYQPLGVDGMPFVSEDLYNKSKKSNGSSSGIGDVDFSKGRTFILGRVADLNVTKKIVNSVLTSTNLTNAVAYLLSSAGASKMLMSNLDNTTNFSELVLLPQPLIPQLKYLNSFYGFYKEGAQIFFDVDSGYILRKSSVCTAWRINEIKTVIITVYDTMTSSAINTGSVIDRAASTAYLGINAGMYQLDDMSNTANEYAGSNSKIIDNTGNISTATTSQGNSCNILTTKNHNPYYSTELQTRIKELPKVLTLTIYNIDMRLFKPNKSFKVISNSTKITKEVAGVYRLASTKVELTKSGNHYTCVGTVVLKCASTS